MTVPAWSEMIVLVFGLIVITLVCHCYTLHRSKRECAKIHDEVVAKTALARVEFTSLEEKFEEIKMHVAYLEGRIKGRN